MPKPLKYTDSQLTKIKSIIHKFDDDIDLDIKNFINLITIFDMLTEKEIHFIQQLKVPFASDDKIQLNPKKISPLHHSLLTLSMVHFFTRASYGINPLYELLGNASYYAPNESSKFLEIRSWNKIHEAIVDCFNVAPFTPDLIKDIPELTNIDNTANTNYPRKAYSAVKKDSLEAIINAINEIVPRVISENPEAFEEFQYAEDPIVDFGFTAENYDPHMYPTSDYIWHKLPQAEMVKKNDQFHIARFDKEYLFNEENDALYIYSAVEFNNTNPLLTKSTLNFAWKCLKPADGLTMFEFYKLLWLKKLISSNWEQSLPNDQTAASLTQLLYLQAKTEIENSKEVEEKPEPLKLKVNESMQSFLRNFDPSLGSDRYLKFITISYKQFYNFIQDVKNNRRIQPEIINWLSSDKLQEEKQSEDEKEQTTKFVENLISDMKLANSLALVQDESKIKEIKELVHDPYTKFDIAEIYAIEPKNNNQNYVSPFDTEVKHKLLVHGTPNSSVLTILRDGLLTRKEIHKDAQVTLTGLGLGDGIYFAQPYQAGKSLGYIQSNNNYIYLFLADVAYSKVYETKSWDQPHRDQGDLIFANRIGSNDRDELVARSSEQVELKYLLAIKRGSSF